MTATDRDTLPEPVIERLRRERREPRPTQFDYLHLTVLRAHLRAAIEEAPRPILDALDVFCGVRPYDDLLPARTRIVGLDIDAHFGEPDVTGDTLGAFDDQSFDLVMCLEALHYAPDPAAAVADMLRVLRPGGTAIVAVPHIHEHNRDTPEWRFTGPQLTALFDGWADVVLRENGGRAVAWTHLTAHLVSQTEQTVAERVGRYRLARAAFSPLYLAINFAGVQLDRATRHAPARPLTLPMNLMVTARRPVGPAP